METTAVKSDQKYLSFKLEAETYAIDILKVREIIGLMEITAVPKTAAHVRGVINLRGKIVPVLDMRAKFGLPAAEARRENCIVTVMSEGDKGPLLVGVLVDSVSEVIQLSKADIEPLPAMGADLRLDFVTGLAKSQDRVTILLDIDTVVKTQDLGGIEGLESALSAVKVMRPARIAAALLLSTGLSADTDFDAKLAEAMKAAKGQVASPAPATDKPRPKPEAASLSNTAEFSDVLARLKALETPKAAAPERLKYEVFSHLRYESQDSRKTRGAYLRRAEAKVTGKLGERAGAVLGFDFAEAKVKDAGLEAEFPAFKLQLGQFRQKFGIEPQTGSLKTWFPERAMVYGGLQPLSNNAKIVGERAMGLHAIHKVKLGAWGLELGSSLANNLSEDQAAGKNKIGAADAFSRQLADENPSLASRLGTDWAPAWGRLALGASYARDSQNAAFLADKVSDQRADEINGVDAAFELKGHLRLQGEWVASNQIRGDLGTTLRREGYYAMAGWKFLALIKEAPEFELLARFENFQPGNLAAVSAGLKWSFYGSQHLVLQYSAFGPNQNFGAGAGSELVILQQQLVF